MRDTVPGGFIFGGIHDCQARRRKQQDMIVVRADESVDGNDAVAAGPVLDDDWLSPALAKAGPPNSRAPRSVPLPGPSVRINFTVRLGQVSARTPWPLRRRTRECP